MGEGIAIALITLLGVPLGIVVGWLLNRKKNVSDIFKNITDTSINAAGDAVEAMHTAMETLSKELTDASGKIDALGKEISELRHQNLLLLRENHALHAKIDELVAIVNTGEIPVVAIDPLPEHRASDPVS